MRFPGAEEAAKARENGRVAFGAAARHVAEHARSLVRLELELAARELRRRVAAVGVGIGLGAGALLLALLGVPFLLAAAAAAIALVLPVWAALLIVTGGSLGLAGLLGGLATATLRRGAPPIPAQAIEEARRTADALRNDVRG